jgi:shikimate kinase
MKRTRNNVALIGMPGAGKSTLGVLLAKRTARDFLDTDIHIQEVEGASLARLIDERGIEAFRRIEERVVLDLDCAHSVIATGGSVVYSEAAMEHLGAIGVRVFLDAPLAELERRLGDLDARGVIYAPGQSFEDLFAERRPLYLRWCDLHIDCDALRHDAIVEAILSVLPPD